MGSFFEILDWDLSPLASGQDATAKRGNGIEQYSSTVKAAPALTNWTGDASAQARALGAVHTTHSDHIANQAQNLTGPLGDYATGGAALKTAAQKLAAEAQSHGFAIGPDGSVTATITPKGLYAQTVAQQLADKATSILIQDDQLHQTLAQAIQAVLNPATHEATRPTGGSATASAGTAPAHIGPGQLYGSGGDPSADDVHQSGIGDCYFDCTMASMANAQPDVVKNAIAYDPKTDSYNVTLYKYAGGIGSDDNDAGPGAFSAPVKQTVNVSQADLKADYNAKGVNSAAPSSPAWPQVMESAYAKLRSPDGSVQAGFSAIGSGAWTDQGMAAVTGNPGVYHQVADVTGDPKVGGPYSVPSYREFSTALANHQPITLDTFETQTYAKDGMVGSHAYSVLAAAQDPSTDDTLLTVRNPWGTNVGVPGHTDPSAAFTIDLEKTVADGVLHEFDFGPA